MHASLLRFPPAPWEEGPPLKDEFRRQIGSIREAGLPHVCVVEALNSIADCAVAITYEMAVKQI